LQVIIDELDGMTAISLGADPGDVPLFRFSEEAQVLFDVWRGSLETRLRSDTEHPILEAHLSKYRSLVPSLALVIHLTEHREGPVQILALERAIAWAEYLESHARRISAPAISPDMDAARLLAKRIQAKDLGIQFSLRDIYNNGWSGLGVREEAAKAVAVLIDYDWLREIEEVTGGRPRIVYVINPAVLPRETQP
jgi:hypothetical protein